MVTDGVAQIHDLAGLDQLIAEMWASYPGQQIWGRLMAEKDHDNVYRVARYVSEKLLENIVAGWK